MGFTAIRAVHRLNGMRNAQIKLECITIAAALNEIGVTPVFFKGGGALLADLYDDPAGRIISDLDILVPATRSAECINRLQAWGYVAGSSPRHPEDHSSAVLFPNSGAAPIDLHRDVVAYPYRHLLPAADVLKHAIVLRREGAVFAVPSSTHQIIINVGHAQLHRNHGFIYGRLMLRSLIEISLMCRRWPDSIDWPEVENRFAGIGASTALEFSPHCRCRGLWQTGITYLQCRLARPPCFPMGLLPDQEHRPTKDQRSAFARIDVS